MNPRTPLSANQRLCAGGSFPAGRIGSRFFDRDRHDDRSGRITTLDQFDRLDRSDSVRVHPQITDLLIAESKRERAFRNIDPTDVVGKMDSVDQVMGFGLAVYKVKPHRHGDRRLRIERMAPTTDAAEQMHGVDRFANGQLH